MTTRVFDSYRLTDKEMHTIVEALVNAYTYKEREYLIDNYTKDFIYNYEDDLTVYVMNDELITIYAKEINVSLEDLIDTLFEYDEIVDELLPEDA